mmetsp:Transcript_20188/g.44889  ORF Transcript_20188/g.44889 Transcript_20188/m.44889 type:complete len:219 (-) Transcript_20188:1640-2296(-)
MSKMVKYFTQEELAVHNNPEDCWLSIFDKVYNLSDLIMEHRGPLSKPLVEAGGSSISHWFNEKTGDLKTYIDPVRDIEMYYTPCGRFIHVPPPDPVDKTEIIALPWWKDEQYVIGQVTKKTMKIRITNMLTHNEDIIKICHEETVAQIRNRYMEYNLNSNSYTWKALIQGEFVTLNQEKTLEENGIMDETENFVRYGMDEDFAIPNLHCYYDDDLHYA